jgi:hypothetical protein
MNYFRVKSCGVLFEETLHDGRFRLLHLNILRGLTAMTAQYTVSQSRIEHLGSSLQTEQADLFFIFDVLFINQMRYHLGVQYHLSYLKAELVLTETVRDYIFNLS